MDPITGALLLAMAIVTSFRSGAKHARSDYERKRDLAIAVPNGKWPAAVAVSNARRQARRRHRTGWWASEIRHGMPVTRTGIHTGWLAHQAASMHTQAQREAARTTHLESVGSFASAVRDHRKRQAVIRAEIQDAITKSPVTQDGSREAVRKAAGAVILPFPGRRPQPVAEPAGPESGPYAVREAVGAGPACSVCGIRLGLRDHDGIDHIDCRESRDKATAVDDAVIEADHAPAGGDAGRACTECGEPLGLRPHDDRSHKDCDRVSNAEADACEVRDSRDTEIVDADLAEQGRCGYQTGTDGGTTYCGREAAETGDDEGELGDYCAEHQATVGDDDEGAVLKRNERVKALLRRDQDVNAHQSATEGEEPMSDTRFSTVKQASAAAIGLADQDVATIRGRKEAALALADQMQGLDVDPAVIDAQMSHADSLAEAERHLTAAGEFAAATGTNLERLHGAMEEATVSAPGRIADRQFHGEG